MTEPTPAGHTEQRVGTCNNSVLWSLKFKGRGKEWQEIRGEPRQVADVLLHLAEALDFAL